MNILHVTPAFHPAYVYGGPIESVYQLCRHLVQEGCKVSVLTTDANGRSSVLDVPKDREVEFANDFCVRYCCRVMGHMVSVALLRAMPSYLRKADVVHLTAVYSFPTLPTLLACRVFNKPIVWSPRGSLQQWERSRRTTMKAVWGKVCLAIAPKRLVLHATSDQEVQSSLQRFPGVHVTLIPNGVQVPDKTTHTDGRGMLRLIYLGRIHPVKGIENLLQSCEILNCQFGDRWSLVIAGAGDPPYMETVRTLIARLRLQQQVRMLGEVVGDAKERLFEHADMLIAPSFTENFGIVIAEALAHGVPVVASTGTPWRRLEEMGCGLWVNNNPENLAKAIERMSRMPLSEMGGRGRDWMKKEFSWDRTAHEMMLCYKRLMT